MRAVEAGPDPEPVYAQRIADAFPLRDGRCCERVADAVVESAKRIRIASIAQGAPGAGRPAAVPLAVGTDSDADREDVAEEVAEDEAIVADQVGLTDDADAAELTPDEPTEGAPER